MSSNFLNALAGTRLYPLTDRRLSGLSHAEQVSQLSEAGAPLLQLREKSLSPLDFYLEAEAALRVARERGTKIIINDRVDIALALKADGVHLGQEDLPPEAARRLLGPEAIIGFSTHNLDQARLAAKMPVDYIAIGPIFATSTKATSDSAIGLEELRLVRQAVGTIPLAAIGGITLENSQDVVSAGADAIAAVSDIWIPTGQAASQTRRLLRHLELTFS
jgi:thiamine-phosphate pyrophosphorylase